MGPTLAKKFRVQPIEVAATLYENNVRCWDVGKSNCAWSDALIVPASNAVSTSTISFGVRPSWGQPTIRSTVTSVPAMRGRPP